MARSFGIVEEKLRETEFFLEKLRQAPRHSSDAKYYFSAFVSAARSVTLAMQASLDGISGFSEWYEHARERLKQDRMAPFFVAVRNENVHEGVNRLNEVTLRHLREDLTGQLLANERPHVLVCPHERDSNATTLLDAVRACTEYFKLLVSIVFDCYCTFRTVVDPRWYFTEENFRNMNRTFTDAVVELGFPAYWADCAPSGAERWRALRNQMPACQINDIFEKYLGTTVPDPDESE